MKKINLKSLTPVELLDLYNQASAMIHKDSESSKQEYIKENEKEWKSVGAKLKKRREALGITLKDMASRLGCSSSKLSNFEKGKPVMVADMLERFYKLVLKNEEAERNEPKKSILDSANLSDEEVREFYDYLWFYICSSDGWFDLYSHTRDEIDGDIWNRDSLNAFYALLCEAIEENDDLIRYEEAYEKIQREVMEIRGRLHENRN